MPAEITMPQLSDTMTEGTLVKWHRKEGDQIKRGDELADIETDKATMPLEAFDTGILAVILVKEGQKVNVGQAIAVIATGSEKPEEIKQKYAAGASAPAKAAPAPKKAAATEAAPEPAKTAAPAATAPTATAVAEPENGKGRQFVSPLARRIAADKNIDLKSLQGSGPGGRIVKEDVLAAASTPAPASPALPALPQRLGSGQTQVVPMTKMRLAIAKSLTASKQSIPHFYETIDADVQELVQMRARLNNMLEPEKIRLSVGDFIAKAVAMALVRHPNVNATFDGTQVTRYGDVHLGMAVAIPDGLIVPVLRNIHLMGIKEIRQRSVDLVDRARAQRLRQDELSGGTFTVSNLGAFGIREFSAIINPPQVAILAIAAAEERAVVRNGQIIPRTMLSLTLSADHRVVDGAAAAEFLRTLKGLLEEPGLMLL